MHEEKVKGKQCQSKGLGILGKQKWQAHVASATPARAPQKQHL